MRYLIVLLACLSLSACGALDPLKDEIAQRKAQDHDADALQVIAEFAADDFDAAYQLAVAADDKPAMQCWPAMKEWAEHLGEYRAMAELAEATTDGIALKYQRARAIRRRLDIGVPEEVAIACSAMLNESQDVLRAIMLRVVRLGL